MAALPESLRVAAKRRCKPGRPKGSTGAGRPVKDLSHDPWRYLYAAAQHAIDHSPIGMSELSICNAFATLMVGRPLRDGEFIIGDHGETIITAREAAAEMLADRPFPLFVEDGTICQPTAAPLRERANHTTP